MKWVTRALVALLVLIVIAAIGAFVAFKWFEAEINAPGPLAGGEAQTIMIPRGAGVIRIGQQLETEGFIEDARLFRAASVYLEVQSSLKAGEYLIPADASIVDILELMEEGDVILHPVQIIEGSTIAQAMAAIARVDVLTGEMPETPEEGSFLPDTYFFTRGTSRVEVVQRLLAAQDTLMEEIWAARQDDLPLASPEEAVILASIVEKETGSVGDEDLVASVFINRLERGMRLQSDPTIIYGISQGERLTRTVNGREIQRGLYRSEIDRLTPYNTYQIDGLPPTPICNPSEAALRAVLQPAESDYLFFVADGSGRHAFSRTNAEHNRNVARWREIERARRAAE
ncbi:endolytic transglycosylase MltG [Ponticaulis sp.]|uniref:endolytic transglycosylase MltG n=1 Tax=Ponticaulis sp. TaxID=2020902 RepID=UPI000B762D00|nr:endolytic transglycosylase MltG [Ponticaulis sp.]MAI91956.1 aminodeoxychorismate lyase [Ponticaulis sp.]OUX96427.1 MAG: hypothetical protein CBB65_16115 [Hyphomonadaceae bacterium TMED5]|tara:strand:+ start:32341 stop:33369 length:1029 start_codon:yes stop_codon:yes gene_type:complete